MRGFIDLILIFMGFTGRLTPKILAMDDVDVDAVSSDVTGDTDDAEGVC